LVSSGNTFNFKAGQNWVQEHGCDATVMNNPGLIKVMGNFIIAKPTLWNEGIWED
jgi:cytosine deaminase